jgi:NAD(P)-dependent dehydrogenase (short-subunit alcohol dehydrogenase family)
VSILLDPNGANTTAAAAVLAAEKHLPLEGASAVVLAATGPVGRRAVRLLAQAGAAVHVGSRRIDRARDVCQEIAERVEGAELVPYDTSSAKGLQTAVDGAQLLIAAGPPGVELISTPIGPSGDTFKVAIDLNAVPPAGIAGVESGDLATDRDGVICYGALGVGGTKMKIHKAAVAKLFTANDLVLDAEEIFQIGRELK